MTSKLVAVAPVLAQVKPLNGKTPPNCSDLVRGVGVAAAREIVADEDRGLWHPRSIVSKDFELTSECGSFGFSRKDPRRFTAVNSV